MSVFVYTLHKLQLLLYEVFFIEVSETDIQVYSSSIIFCFAFCIYLITISSASMSNILW